jgi:hypothetical protein
LRKYLTGGIALLIAAACGTTAVAATNAVTMKSSVSPKKAGTKTKPKNTVITTTITGNDHSKITTAIDIQLPKTFNVSGKGFPTCGAAKMVDSAGSACPAGSKVGHGTANAMAGINTSAPFPVTFDVTAFVQSASKVNFLLVARGLGNVYNAPGRLKKNTKGTLLHVVVPPGAQEPIKSSAPGTTGLWATLTKLTTTLGAKRGSHLLIGSTGCKAHKQPLAVTLHLATPPSSGDTAVPAGRTSASGPAKCS